MSHKFGLIGCRIYWSDFSTLKLFGMVSYCIARISFLDLKYKVVLVSIALMLKSLFFSIEFIQKYPETHLMYVDLMLHNETNLNSKSLRISIQFRERIELVIALLFFFLKFTKIIHNPPSSTQFPHPFISTFNYNTSNKNIVVILIRCVVGMWYRQYSSITWIGSLLNCCQSTLICCFCFWGKKIWEILSKWMILFHIEEN